MMQLANEIAAKPEYQNLSELPFQEILKKAKQKYNAEDLQHHPATGNSFVEEPESRSGIAAYNALKLYNEFERFFSTVKIISLRSDRLGTITLENTGTAERINWQAIHMDIKNDFLTPYDY